MNLSMKGAVMKKILGSLLLLSLSLFARSAYEWKVDLSEYELYQHQSTLLTMQCTFSAEGKNDDVEFSPPSELPFEFELLSEKKHFVGDIQTLTYEYLIFAKEEGAYELHLKPSMLFTTQSAIDDVIVGRDNVNDLEVEKEVAKIAPLKIKVLPTTSSLTGRLDLKTDLDLQEVSAFEPVHLEIRIEGEGNLQELHDIAFEIEGVQVFADKPEKDLVLSEHGYKGVWLQRFAFVGEKSFSIPAIEIDYFDLEKKGESQLKTPDFEIKIKANGIERDTLIDEVDLPSEKIDFSKYVHYLYYLLSFIAGFIVAKLFKLPTKTVKKEKGIRIKTAQNNKELLEVLIVCDKMRFEEEIQRLEEAVYQGSIVDISGLKKSALEKL